MGGAALFLMTVWLLLKGGPHVGVHLCSLGHYLAGYTVSCSAWEGEKSVLQRPDGDQSPLYSAVLSPGGRALSSNPPFM